MDTAWDGIATAVMRPVLGPLTSNLAQHAPFSSTPSFDPGWFGYVSKDLRTELGMKVRGPYSRRYCGNGSLKALPSRRCGRRSRPRRSSCQGSQGPNPSSWHSSATAERITFIPGLIPFTMRWTNRSTFQQVIEFTGHAGTWLTPTLQSSASAVRVEGVTKRFGATVALAGVDLEVAEGTVFGLLGPNGAGKTTLVRVLATLLTPDAGRAEVFGRDVVHEAAAVRQLLGLTGQFAAVDEILTGRENLQMFGRLFDLSPAEARRRTGELLERFELADAADRPARTYSGGMRRRLDLASSLLTRPRILFLDEPTTGLDPRSRNEIWAIVRELVREGTTLLLTTQYLEEADQLADRIAVIDHGRVIAQGTGNELKDQVGGQILEVELTSAATSRRGAVGAGRVGCGDPEPGERLDQLTLPAPRDGLELIEDAASALRHAGIGVSDLGLRRPTLDDVFLQLTGAPPSEDGAGPEASAGRRRPRPRRARSAAADRRARRSLRVAPPLAAAGCARPSPTRAWSPAATCATSSASRSC